ncbi:MAG TPA: hypothetical protein VH061_04695 [Solirubrobacteraceae bacterium]|nr:hypothetical protein [Solirubrobacteraceae bacterium]
MISSEVQRTLVKSPPELWSELSDPDALARHLGELGEISITRTEPEKLVEWEAQGTTGTVAIKASGWGTKVTLTVHHEPAAVAEPEESEPSDSPEDDDPQEASTEAQDKGTALAEPTSTVPQPSTEPTVVVAETPAEPKPAPATEAARRAAGWPDARGQVGPAIESDLRAAEAGASPDVHAPWHLGEAEHAPQVEGKPSTETEPAPAEPRRGFFARLFGSRRKRPAPDVAETNEPIDLALEQLQVTSPVAVTHPLEAPALTVEPEPEPVALTEPDDGATGEAETESTEPEAAPDPEPPTASEDLAAELKAAEEIAAEQVKAVLTSVLDRLGAAHHRPFSRS